MPDISRKIVLFRQIYQQVTPADFDKVFSVDVDLDGGILILPPIALMDIDEESRFYMNAVLDPLGNSCETGDYDGPWDKEWPKAVAEVENKWLHPTSGMVLLTGGGEFFIKFTERITDDERSHISESVEGFIRVTDGEIIVTEGMVLFDDHTNGRAITIANGDYHVRVHRLNDGRTAEEHKRVYGSPNSAGIVVELVRLGPGAIVDTGVRKLATINDPY